VTPLHDAIAPATVLAVPPATHRGDKTASMYAALTPDHFSEGYATIGVRETVESGRAITDEELANAFEAVTTTTQPETARAMAALAAQGYTPHLCGSGPSFFLLANTEAEEVRLSARVAQLGFEPVATRALTRADAMRIERT
jgi:4-diphosphocytidyl-2C-methyl-D-erythritol kinase